MPGRRSNTGAQPTPLEETEPTGPAVTPPPDTAPEPGTAPLEEDPPEPDGSYEDPTPLSVREQVEEALQEALRKAGRGNPLNLFGWQLGAARSAAAEEGDYPLTVHEAIAEVTQRVEAIAKGRTASQGGSYKYRGIDDVLAALHPVLGDVGLVILPGRMVEHRRETRATRNGGTLNVALVRVRYTLIGPDGTKTFGEAWGEAGDAGDKATQKALSQAYKTFALQTFSIPTEESRRDDPDVTNEPGRPFTAEEVGRASNAWQAAKRAESLDALVGVRRRAEHLLPVPVPMPEEGDAVPLSVLFDRRLRELESAVQS
jgi:hypothetical protein